ncbi:membrane alanyl aminopeptidase-like [Achroia grisella]|uniref:membrane alanyl aminopeptidase-like n=1 Tax=Achroia grisella TaxID=688607 RepID=UPI0027D2797F|nr:membrane alanyl aminopeptidase-like [Achroia grisella]
MAMLKLSILAAAFVCACAVPHPPLRNTIFGDEKLEGQIFENLQYQVEDSSSRNIAANEYRLPTTTIPVHYNVLWNIVLTTYFIFNGEVTINLTPTQAGVNEIVIHSEDLNITSLSLKKQGSEANLEYSYFLQPDLDFLRVQLFNSTLDYDANVENIYELTIGFSASLRTDMYGIYRSWYFENPNNTALPIYMASTQFQGTSARKAFPCYDEPSFKATFDIRIRHSTQFKSWSCTRINNTIPEGTTYVTDVYHTTPKMSTYLLALIVADYDSRPVNNTQGLITYEVIGRHAAFEDSQYEYAFDVGQALLAEMNNITDIDFYEIPHMKMTQASIPDFSAGAMENWGLLTYREAYLMYNSEHTNSNSKQLIAYILSHEIAHMWFGNLVTNEWWDVLWLNEGFARYYQYFLTHEVETYMEFETRFITEQIHTSLLADSVTSAHPLSHSGIGSQESVSGMFSTLSYNKGAAVIRMTEKLLGSNVHKQGLRNYLKNRAFDIAAPIHLFQELQNVAEEFNATEEYGADFSVIDYYQSWTEQAGHPVLNVQVNHQTGQMLISQQRFDINSGYSTALRNWVVPITFATKSNPYFENTKPTHVISDGIAIINRGSVGDEWVIFNIQQTGFYRVNYDNYTWDLNALALRQNSGIHEYNKAQIVNDVFQFARAGLMPYHRALNILSFLENEVEYAPWVAAITGFNWLRNRLAGTENLPKLESLIANWTTTVIGNITYEPLPNETGTNFMRSYLRMQLAPTLCAINAPGCRDVAIRQFQEFVEGTEVPVDSRPWVYCNGLRNSTNAVVNFNFLYNRFKTHTVYNEKIVILSALGCTIHRESLITFLTDIFEDNYIIRPQDYSTAFNAAVSGNEENTQIVFEFIKQNLTLVENGFRVTSRFRSPLISPLSTIASRLRTEAEINEFQQWAVENRQVLGSAFGPVMNAAEDTRQSISWTKGIEGDLLLYLEEGGASIQTSTSAPTTTPLPSSTVTANPVVAPPTPELPDSAVTSALSISIIVGVAIINFAL